MTRSEEPDAYWSQLSSRFEVFNYDEQLAYYENLALGRPSRLTEVYERHSELFSEDTVRKILPALLDESEARRAERLLSGALVANYLARKVKELTDEGLNISAESKIIVDGETIAYRMYTVRMRNEADRSKRRAILYAALPVRRRLNELHERSRRITYQALRDLGFESFVEISERLRFFNAEKLRLHAESLISSTEGLYQDWLRTYCGQADLHHDDFRLYDVGRLLRGERFDSLFPREGMIKALKETARNLGIRLDQLANITIDEKEREAKSPRAFCAIPKVPEDIRLVVKPSGGYDDYMALFHEAGHALHYAHTKEPDAAYKYAGDNAVTETFAFTMDSLLAKRAWLEWWLGGGNPMLEEVIRLNAFHKLYLVRRYCGKFLFELEYHGEEKEPRSLYSELSYRASRVRVEAGEADFYPDFDEGFYTANYLKAWFLQAQLDKQLTEEFGEDWFRKEEAGERLRGIWAYGQKYSAQELAQLLGLGGLSPHPLIEGLKGALMG